MKKALLICYMVLCLWMGCTSIPAFSGEIYRFELMWPQNTEPWYFNWPQDVAADSSGNVFVADTMNDRIQKFDSNGHFIAKWGTSGTGDGQFDSPASIAVASDGSLYVADRFNDRIQKFDSNGNFLTKWGSKGDGEGEFFDPRDIAVDSSGNVYVVEILNHRVQKFDSNGNFLTKWGGSFGTGNGQFGFPDGVAVDSLGNVFVVDSYNSRIQKFDSEGTFIGKWSVTGHILSIAIDHSGIVYTTSQQYLLKHNSNGDLIVQWEIEGSGDMGITVDSSGNIYLTGSQYVDKLTPSGELLARWSLAGNGDGQFNYPSGIGLDSSGNVYVADASNDRIQKFDATGEFIAKWVVSQNPKSSVLAVDSSGNVYLTDRSNDRIQKFDSEGNLLASWAFPFDWNSTQGIAVDSIGNVFITRAYNVCFYGGCPDQAEASIQKLDSNGSLVLRWGSYGTGDGQFRSPSGIAIDAANNIYVADTGSNRIQKFDSDGNFITKWGSEGSGDGQFQWYLYLVGIAVDPGGNVYASDPGNDRIHKFDSNGNWITTWGIEGIGRGEFSYPTGIAVDSSGNVYVADRGNHRIQKFSLVGQEIISAPSTPSGPASGMVGSAYPFSTGSATSDLGHAAEYRFSWGDGTYSNWSSSTLASKSWSSPGAYSVKSQARCSIDISIESTWSETLTVSVNQNDLPDLTGQWNSLNQMCRETLNGKKCRISGRLVIQNIGNKNTSSSLVRFYLSDDAQYDQGLDIFLRQVATGKIKAGRNMIKTLSYNFRLGETASGKYVIAVIDANNTVTESGENNNYVVFGPIP